MAKKQIVILGANAAARIVAYNLGYDNRVEVVGLFWHFVDLVWIFVFPIFYLL